MQTVYKCVKLYVCVRHLSVPLPFLPGFSARIRNFVTDPGLFRAVREKTTRKSNEPCSRYCCVPGTNFLRVDLENSLALRARPIISATFNLFLMDEVRNSSYQINCFSRQFITIYVTFRT